ncbi:MAG: hypothetical protein ABJP34_04500 [Erythrobacter sp.]
MMMKNAVLGSAVLGLAMTLGACSGGSGGDGTTYDEQLSCYTTLMDVNAANRASGEELPGATNALLLIKTLEVEDPSKAQQIAEDIHASSFKIQEIAALSGAELAALDGEAKACSEKFKD